MHVDPMPSRSWLRDIIYFVVKLDNIAKWRPQAGRVLILQS